MNKKNLKKIFLFSLCAVILIGFAVSGQHTEHNSEECTEHNHEADVETEADEHAGHDHEADVETEADEHAGHD
ncbi:MAG: hypothetical protein ACQETH_11475, partial [Candidatus Rifleibacteriota bacterium]